MPTASGLLVQFTGTLQTPPVPVTVGGGARSAAQHPAGEPAGLQNHHPGRESRTQDELHRQRAGRPTLGRNTHMQTRVC